MSRGVTSSGTLRKEKLQVWEGVPANTDKPPCPEDGRRAGGHPRPLPSCTSWGLTPPPKPYSLLLALPTMPLVTAPDGSGKARTEEVLLPWPRGPGPTRSLSCESASLAEGPVMEPEEVLCHRERLRTSPQGRGEGWMGGRWVRAQG